MNNPFSLFGGEASDGDSVARSDRGLAIVGELLLKLLLVLGRSIERGFSTGIELSEAGKSPLGATTGSAIEAEMLGPEMAGPESTVAEGFRDGSLAAGMPVSRKVWPAETEFGEARVGEGAAVDAAGASTRLGLFEGRDSVVVANADWRRAVSRSWSGATPETLGAARTTGLSWAAAGSSSGADLTRFLIVPLLGDGTCIGVGSGMSQAGSDVSGTLPTCAGAGPSPTSIT